MAKYECNICGFVYDESVGLPNGGIAPGTKWDDLPSDWECPICGAPKSSFTKKEDKVSVSQNTNNSIFQTETSSKESSTSEKMKEINFAELSILCSNLAKGCEKQYLERESELFHKLADYYKNKAGTLPSQNFQSLSDLITHNLNVEYPDAAICATKSGKPDRGALRAIGWSEKVTHMLDSLLKRYEKEKDAMLRNTNIYVCEICGFIYIGSEPPAICPVCKVPNKKLTKVEREV